MKGFEALQKTYNKQKELFDVAKARRIQNRNVQIQQIQEKIESLKRLQQKLLFENQNEKDFESFEFFRSKAEKQSREQKN